MSFGVLARLAGVLVALVAAEIVLLPPGGDEPQAALPPASPAAPLAPARTGPDVAELVADVLARPVFSVSRRPAPEAPAAAQPPAGPSGLPRLTGILVGGGVKTAIFAGAGDGKAVAVSERGRVGSYTVQSIETDRATVTGPSGAAQVLRPTFDPNAPVAATPPAAPQQGFFPQVLVPQQPPQPAQPGQSSILDALRRTAPRVGVPGLNPLPQAPEQ
jgi:hypothetical protein